MTARRAFVLGAIVGAGVLATVGAVSASSSSSRPVYATGPSARPQSRVGTPESIVGSLKALDVFLERFLEDVKNQRFKDYLRDSKDIRDIKRELFREYASEKVAVPASEAL